MNKSAKQPKQNTDKLAREFAELEGIEQQFDILVRQVIDNQRKAAVARVMGKPGATPSRVAQETATLESALEKMEHNLRAQYEDYVAAQVAFRASNFTPAEMSTYIDFLKDERVQIYLAKARNLQGAAGQVFGPLIESMIRRAAMGSAR